MNQPTEGRVLLVGEGNFSLSSSLVEGGTISGPQLIASCLDTFTAVQENHQLAAANIDFLEKAGGTVLFEVDATDLHNHPDIQFYQFERVIFNFPLADRHNIKKNRALLSDFFSSVKNILDPENGQVMVTLCKGQGGTPADQPMRSWHDSWQVVSMAANAGLILTQIYPFHAQNFSRYKSVGFRFQDKGFSMDSALTHVFEVATSVGVPALSAGRCVVPQDRQDFVVSPYIHRKHDRWSLLEQKDHPVVTLCQYLAQRISTIFPELCVMPPNPPLLIKALPGYVSSLRLLPSPPAHPHTDLMPQAAGDTQMDGTDSDMTGGRGEAGTGVIEVTSETATGESCEGGDSSKQRKELKNRQTVAADKQVSGSQVCDTHVSGSQVCDTQVSGSQVCAIQTADRSIVPDDIASSDSVSRPSFQHGVDRVEGVLTRCDGSHSAVPFSPLTYPVFVVHIAAQSSTRHRDDGDDAPQSSVGTDRAGAHERSMQDGQCREGVQTMDTSDRDTVTADESSTEQDTVAADGHLSQDTVAASGNVREAEKTDSGIDLREGTPHGDGSGACPVDTLFHLRCSLLENLPHLQRHMMFRSLRAIFTSAIVFRKCPISPTELAASHESMLLTNSAESCAGKLAGELCGALKLLMDADTGALVTVTPTSQCLLVGQMGRVHIRMALTLQRRGGAYGGPTLGFVFLYESGEGGGTQGAGDEGSGHNQTRKLGAVLYLDTILLHALHLPDVRLLWSQDKRFRQQFTQGYSPQDLPAFRPISMYPVRFVHDISFWESGQRVFEEGEFLDLVRDVTDDTVTSVTLSDKFEDGSSGKTSRCYRLVFQSHDHALSYITSWKLQSLLRLKVAQQLGVTLR